MNTVTLMTDFGTKSGYVAQMKGVLLSHANAINIVDITHEISPQNVREGAFVLKQSVKYFPKGTIHIAVVDPGVGTERKAIIVPTRSQILIGPDNGLLMPAARYLGDFEVHEISNPLYMMQNVSNTFHGRDILSTVAANIIKGVPFDQFGKRLFNFVDLDFGQGIVDNQTATGKIIHIDSFGNIITNIDGDKIKKYVEYGEKLMIFIGSERKEITFFKSYGFARKNQILATVGSSNLFEIVINQGDAAKRLGIKLDDEIKILFF
ncbi:MAG: S-adenosyl-l-methionine hydroxide adenosyltransferase family protein [Candidatus Thermoplasmatota archaeon]|nr:S-adenosyl-l-methionine hydroxide adenosyltransferase family protein [Candidatus Thermoplasmatota archaeon]